MLACAMTISTVTLTCATTSRLRPSNKPGPTSLPESNLFKDNFQRRPVPHSSSAETYIPNRDIGRCHVQAHFALLPAHRPRQGRFVFGEWPAGAVLNQPDFGQLDCRPASRSLTWSRCRGCIRGYPGVLVILALAPMCRTCWVWFAKTSTGKPGFSRPRWS